MVRVWNLPTRVQGAQGGPQWLSSFLNSTWPQHQSLLIFRATLLAVSETFCSFPLRGLDSKASSMDSDGQLLEMNGVLESAMLLTLSWAN